MADKKISELNSASAVYDADDFALVQDAETKQVNASVVKTYVKDGLSKSDVGLANVDNTSDAAKNAATVTLTNKTISGSSNTLSDISNASLTNSAITINGNAVSLGGSTTVTATASNALTLGTGLTGTSYNGSTAVTTAIDTGVVTTLTGTQTLTNKTLTSPVISGGTINNAAIGGTTAASGAFTTLSASSTVSGVGFSNYLASPPAIGGSSPAAGNFTTLGATGAVTLSGGTANGVAYLNGSKVLTTGSGLTFDGTKLAVLSSSAATLGSFKSTSTSNQSVQLQVLNDNDTPLNIGVWGSSAGSFGILGASTPFIITNASTLNFANINASGSIVWGIGTSATEAMRLTSNGLEVKQSQLIGYTSYSGLGSNGLAVAGNVGIGTSSPIHKLDVQAGFISTYDPTNANGAGYSVRFYSNANAGSRAEVARFGGMQDGAGNNGKIVFATSTSGSVTEKMVLDSSGNLGLGVTPSSSGSTYYGSQMRTLTVQSANITSAAGYDAFFSQNAYRLSDGSWVYQGNGGNNVAHLYGQLAGGNHAWSTAPSGAAGATILFNQAMTLTAAGNLLVGKTSTGVANNGAVIFSAGTFQSTMAGTSTNYHAIFANNAGTTVGSITSSGSVTAYNTASDYRLKTNVAPAGSAVESILNFPVDQFDWIASGEHQCFGAVAQKAIHFIPEMVHAPADEDEMWGIDWSKAVPRLIKTVQELHAEIESLKQSIN